MDTALLVAALIGTASLLAWGWLVAGRGRFWRMDRRLEVNDAGKGGPEWPAVSVLIPARNEAGMLSRTLPTLLRQDYPGPFHVFLVDDRSEDGTAEAARRIAREGGGDRLTVIEGEPLPPGWTGKVWALQQALVASGEAASEFLLLTDADIAHHPGSLGTLALKAQREGLDLVSLMVRLRTVTRWERLLMPAFVYFFAKLYPFPWVSDPRSSTAAAAGGCVLLRRQALEAAAGLAPIAGALIDDCALAALVKGRGGRLWLGLTRDLRSLREYSGLGAVWNMVARSAYAQLKHSPVWLAATVVGMLVVYLVPPLAALGGLAALAAGLDSRMGGWLAASGLLGWALMAGSYVPALRWHGVSPLLAPSLPLTALLYTMMTVDSALRHWRGGGGAWRGRTYAAGRDAAPSE